MRRLDELPHRFWPASRLPPGVEVWPKFMNLKAAEFAKVYNRKVNPRLRALGFTCKATRARGRDGDAVTLGWFAGGKAGGCGHLAFAAHRVGLPSSLDRAVAPDDVDFADCMFYRPCRLHDDFNFGGQIDLGKDVAEAEETAERILEVIEEQAVPFLAGVPVALAALDALRVDELEARLPGLIEAHYLRVGSSTRPPLAGHEAAYALLLARLASVAGRRDAAAAWARRGREALGASDPTSYPYHLHSIFFEKLIAGDPDLTLTAADRAEHGRRMALARPTV